MNKHKKFSDSNIKFSINPGFESLDHTPKALRGSITEGMIIKQLSNLSHLTLEVTDACNLNCEYCGYGSMYSDHDDRTNKYMKFEQAKILIDYLISFWNSPANKSFHKTVRISFYGGEPLLNFALIKEVVDYTGSLNLPQISFRYGMTTNALLVPRYLDYLADKKFSLLISLDGNEYNHSYRIDRNGVNSFNRVMEAVKCLQESYPDYFEDYVNFNAVLHNRNSVKEVYTFIHRSFGKIPNMGELNNVGIRPEKREQFMQTYRNMKESLQNAENYDEINKELFFKSPDTRSLSLLIHQYSGNVYRKYTDLLFEKEAYHTIPTGTCLPFSRKLFLTVNNKILPCERIGQQFVLGYVRVAGVDMDPEGIAAKYNHYYDKLREQCNTCYLQRACIQCIFNIEDIEGNPVCRGYMNKERFMEYVSGHMEYLRSQPGLYDKIMNDLVIN